MQKAQQKRLTIVLASLAGLLIAWRVFPMLTQSRNPKIIKNKIVNAFTKAGYSITMGQYWAVIAMLESDFLQSNFYKKGNNLFGMNFPNVRPTTATGKQGLHEGNPMAKYSSADSSIKDIILYLDYFNYPKNFNSLMKMVGYMKQKGYFSGPAHMYYMKAKAAQAKLNEIALRGIIP